MTQWMAEMDSATINWRKVGEGSKNLVLLHGFGPMTELQWKDMVMELHHDFTIYIPDLIYFGTSTSSYANYDPRFIARQLSTSLDHEKVSSWYLAGISYGGLISGIMASQQPEKTEGLILIDALSKFMHSGHADSLANSYGYTSMNEILIHCSEFPAQ